MIEVVLLKVQQLCIFNQLTMPSEQIIFPPAFSPVNAPVFVHNEIDINATPEKLWYWLTNAVTWQQWYINASRMNLFNQSDQHLLAGTKFTWKTFGVNLKSEVQENVVNERLARNATAPGIRAYHAWLIVPTAKGCKVITEETQQGLLCRMGKLFTPNRMYKYHQIWLEGLKRKAENQ